MIKTGRYGEVLYDPAATTPVKVVSIKGFKASFKTDRHDVTCFGDDNKVTVPGLPEVSGDLTGFWNSAADASPVLFNAALAEVPGMLKLVPNNTETGFFWTGLAYLDADIDTNVDGAPAISATWSAAGPWTFETAP